MKAEKGGKTDGGITIAAKSLQKKVKEGRVGKKTGSNERDKCRGRSGSGKNSMPTSGATI